MSCLRRQLTQAPAEPFVRRAIFPITTKKSGTKKIARNVAASIPPKHAGPDGVTACRAGSGGDNERKYSQNEGHRRHDNWAETKMCRFERGIQQRFARSIALICELDDQDSIFSGQPDQGDQTDLEINIIGQPPYPDGQQRSQNSKGYARMTAKGMDQLSYKAASTRKTMSRAKANTTMDCPPALRS